MLRFVRIVAIILGVVTLAAGASLAAPSPTPVPGGANAVTGVSGAVGQTLFNGILRVTIVNVQPASPDELASLGGIPPTQKALTMTALLRNGQTASFIDLLKYTLADKDDVTFEIPDHTITPNPPSILQGAAFRQKAIFPIDKDFVPVKLIVTCASCSARQKFTAFRVRL
jgi:hypothetical protein